MATDALLSSCCGLDVHSRFVTACVLSGPSQKPKKDIRSFASTAAGLLELRDWLIDQGCRAVAMESTGVYWKPVWHLITVLSDVSWTQRQGAEVGKGRSARSGG